jgi:hypothetical protein
VYQTTVVSLMAGICFVADFAAGVTVQNCGWLLFSVTLMEGYSLWAFGKERVIGKGIKFLTQFYTYCWIFKIGLKTSLPVVIVIFGFDHLASRIVAGLAAGYYTANLLSALCFLGMNKGQEGLAVVDIYRIMYRVWRVIFAIEFSILLFNLEASVITNLNFILLPSLLFSALGLISIGFVVCLQAMRASKKQKQRAKVNPLRLVADKGSVLQDSADASKDTSGLALGQASGLGKSRPQQAKSDLLGGAFAQVYWGTVFAFTVFLCAALLRNQDLFADPAWVRGLAASVALAAGVLALAGYVFLQPSM